MRAFAHLALPLLLTLALSEQAPAAPATKAAGKMVTANGSKPGAYQVTEADGTVGRTILKADGTYKDLTAKGKVKAEGKWSVAKGKTCFTPSTKGKQAMCFKETAAAKDGSFTATPDKGKPVTVKPAK